MKGQMEQKYIDEPRRVEPLEERHGYPVDYEFIGAWASALAQLETDAGAELPGLYDHQ
jgi:hypothetical protein